MMRMWPDEAVHSMWEELHELLEPAKWPDEERARRKLYFRLSRMHHPDKPTGSEHRFEMLTYVHDKANHAHDPVKFPWTDPHE
jgi:hypothetical protein